MNQTPTQEQLLKLLEAAKEMGVEKDLDRLLNFLAFQGAEALKAERCSIFLLDEDKEEIWSKVALKEAEDIRFPQGKGVAGQCIQNETVINIADAYQDPRFNPSIDKSTGFVTKSILAVPMTNNHGKAVGCFQIVNKKDGLFNQIDENFATAFAAQAAIAIESAILYQDREQIINDLRETRDRLAQKMDHLQVVYELEKEANSSHSTEECFQVVLRLATAAVGGSFGTLLLEGEENWDLYVSCLNTESQLEKFQHLSIRANEVKRPVESDPGKSFIVSNSPCENSVKEILGPHVTTGDLIGVTLAIDEKEDSDEETKKGVLKIYGLQGTQFSEDHCYLMELMGTQVSSLINRRRLMEAQQKSNHLATIGQLSGTIFHDFKNPMGAIRGFAEIIQSGKNLSPGKVDRYCSIIVAQVDRCISMVEELLCFARGEKNYDFEKINIKEFIDEIVFILSVETDRMKINLQVDLEYEGELKLDKDKIMRVIYNLTNNAIEMLKEGDTLTLKVVKTPDNEVEIQVIDTGPGVPEHLRPTLFDAFVTHGKKKGTGLGLHIAKEIVQSHQGTVFLRDPPPGTTGACFVIRLNPDF